jgi:hypothetical protein
LPCWQGRVFTIVSFYYAYALTYFSF